MSGEEWLACRKPEKMLQMVLPLNVGDELMLPLAVHLCRRVEHLLRRECREAVDFVERSIAEPQPAQAWHRTQEKVGLLAAAFPSGGNPSHLAETAVNWLLCMNGHARTSYAFLILPVVHRALECDGRVVLDSLPPRGRKAWHRRLRRSLCDLITDLLGGVFSTTRPDPAWRNPVVLSIAAEIVQAEAFAEMPVLADALEDAGCQDAWLLGHLRRHPRHERQCWALRQVLG